MTNFVTIESVREAHAAVIRITEQMRHVTAQVERHPDDSEIRDKWNRIVDEWHRVREEAAGMRYEYCTRSGVASFPGEVP